MTLADETIQPQSSPPMAITTHRQIRAARSLLGWPQTRLADETGLSVQTIKLAEIGASIRDSTALAIELAFDRAGLIFIDRDTTGGPGVRLKS
jgi:DNA-binding XRE family transcriptional regulator